MAGVVRSRLASVLATVAKGVAPAIARVPAAAASGTAQAAAQPSAAKPTARPGLASPRQPSPSQKFGGGGSSGGGSASSSSSGGGGGGGGGSGSSSSGGSGGGGGNGGGGSGGGGGGVSVSSSNKQQGWKPLPPRTLPDAVAVVCCTLNNIHACVRDLDGDVVASSSGGRLGYKHRARATPFAALDLGAAVGARAYAKGHRTVRVELKGPSRGRAQVVRGLVSAGLQVHDIRDVTPMPTNGCRPKAMRRL